MSNQGRAPFAVFAVLGAAALLTGLAPDPRTWGVHQLAFLPRATLLCAAVVLAALALPGWAAQFGSAVATGAGRWTGSWPAVLAGAAALGFVFYGARLRFPFLGDGIVWLEMIGQRESFHHFEPLAAALVAAIAWQASDPRAAAGWLSIALGVVYVILVAALVRVLWREREPRGVAALLLLAHPVLLLFFGYVESYPLLLVLQVGLAIALVHPGRYALAVAVGVASLAVAAHLQAVLWLPALLLVLWLRARAAGAGASRRELVHGGLAVAVAFGGALLLIRLVGASPMKLARQLAGESGLGGANFSALVAGRRLIDLPNEIALVLGPMLVLGAAALGVAATFGRGWFVTSWRAGVAMSARGGPATSARAAGPATSARAAGPDSVRWTVLALLAVGPILFLLLVVPRIGGARDWDLYLSIVLPSTLLAVQGAWRGVEGGRGANGRRDERERRFHAAAGFAVGLAAIATTTWLAVNLNSERAARRMVVLQDERGPFTKFARGYANEALGIYYRQRDPRQARQAYTRAVAANPANPRYLNNLGNVELQLQNLPAAREAFARAAALGMRTDFLLYNLAVTEAEIGNRAAAESVFAEVVERWPKNWRGIMGLAQIRIQLGRAAEALPLVERAETLVPASSKADVLYLRGLALRDLGRRADARTTFEAALRLEPGHVHSQKALEKLAAGP